MIEEVGCWTFSMCFLFCFVVAPLLVKHFLMLAAANVL